MARKSPSGVKDETTGFNFFSLAITEQLKERKLEKETNCSRGRKKSCGEKRGARV